MAAAVSPAHAAALITNGDFDSLFVGAAPDAGKPAGRWFWPADYRNYPGIGGDLGETAASRFTIVPAPAVGAGNTLRLSFGATEHLGESKRLANALA